jgi:hypothetical protein
MSVETVLWRRLDQPGHDACRLEPVHCGWRLSGTAVFGGGAVPTMLTYQLMCDRSWRTQHGRVVGWIGAKLIEYDVRRTTDGTWLLNQRPLPELAACVDLDYAFTPATNVAQLRRVDLRIGQSADVPVAWLDVETERFIPLPQRYERRSETLYWYEAPTAGYAGELVVNAMGFAKRYPGLWQML